MAGRCSVRKSSPEQVLQLAFLLESLLLMQRSMKAAVAIAAEL